MSVDEFVRTRVPPDLQPAVALIRDLMRKHAPQAQELIREGSIDCRGRHIMAVITPSRQDITLSFPRGAQLVDRYGMLRGSGGASRHVKIKTAADTDPEALRDYIQQALELDAR